MKKNKKILLSLALIIALFLCLNIEGKATEPDWGFPASIESYNYGLMNQDGVNIYEKGYKADGYGSGRAFCTLFSNDYWTADCSATWWNRDTNENERIAVAVGNMIKKARDITGSGGGIDQDVYFYTEMAINRFLYLYNGYHSVNNVADILSWSSWDRVSNRYTYNLIYYAGVAAYNNYGSDKGGSRAKFANLNVTKKDDGTVTATGNLICYDLESNRIRCNARCKDTITLIAEYPDGNGVKTVEETSGSCKKASDGMYYIYTATKKFDSPNSITKVTANFKTTNTASYRVAHEYYCGSSYNQNLTPNLLGEINPTIEVSGRTSRSYKPTTDTTEEKEPTDCDGFLQKIKDDKNLSELERRTKLENLYKKYEKEKYTQLLNFNDPACAVATNCSAQSNTSCLNSNFSNSSFDENNLSCYNNTITDTDQHVGYCLTTYNLEPTSYYNSKKVHSGQLYFDVKDGEILEGNFSQTCYFPSGTTLTSKENGNVSDYINNLKMKNSKETINLSMKEDSSINLKRNNNELSYSTKIKYTIPEIWLELGGKRLTKQECEDKGKNCILAGYGIISPLEKSGTEEYKFEITFNKDNKNASCFYETEPEIIESSKKLNLEFRVIDTEKPFTSRLNKDRNTMTNWCVDVDKINKNILTKKFEDKTVNIDGLKEIEDKSQKLNIESSESAKSTAKDETNDSTENNLDDSKPSSGNDMPTKAVVEGNTNSLNDLQFINRFNIDGNNIKLNTADVSILNRIENSIENYKMGKIKSDELEKNFKSLKLNGGFGAYYDSLDRGDIYKDGIINNVDRDILYNMAQGISPSKLFSNPCSSNNYVVQRMISQRPNSYGIQKGSNGTTKNAPKYKITLTPQLMEEIKKKAKENNITYNNFNLECKDIEGFNICRSKLLNELRTSGDLKFN